MPPEKENIAPIVEAEVEPEPVATEAETFTFKRSHVYAVFTVLAFAAGVLLGYVVRGIEPAAVREQVVEQTPVPMSEVPVQEVPVTEEPIYRRYKIPIEDAYADGPADAPITLVEFGDYQCPYCRRWHTEVYESLLAAYPGKIRFVYRHLPLTSIHPSAFAAAEAALCAGEQDAYWQFHEKLFSSDSLEHEIYLQYAGELELDMDQFEACLNERKYQEAVQADYDFAIDLGIRSTPTFFVNGLAVVGAQPVEVFKQVIDRELAGEIP